MSFAIPHELEAGVDELISHYPEKRSASLMLLHAVQEHFGFVSDEAIEWVAGKLGLRPINIFELVTFYPMFRREPLGKTHVKICRTLSCALAGSGELRTHLCHRLGLDAHKHEPQTTPDGRYTVEFVECLADCANAPVMMINDDLMTKATPRTADEILVKQT
jgi:NADH-quinone oxidoreductase subunit E